MAEYGHSAHATYDLKYHVIRITKYGYQILRGRLAERDDQGFKITAPTQP